MCSNSVSRSTLPVRERPTREPPGAQRCGSPARCRRNMSRAVRTLPCRTRSRPPASRRSRTTRRSPGPTSGDVDGPHRLAVLLASGPRHQSSRDRRSHRRRAGRRPPSLGPHRGRPGHARRAALLVRRSPLPSNPSRRGPPHPGRSPKLPAVALSAAPSKPPVSDSAVATVAPAVSNSWWTTDSSVSSSTP